MILEGLFDSHTHWLPTGQVLLGLRLNEVRSESDLRALQIRPEHCRGEWITGFGWDENQFTNLKLHRKTLDQIFPDRPVFFSRTDGHSSWLNSSALKKLNLLDCRKESFSKVDQDMLEFDSDSLVSGVLKERFHIEALLSLPEFSKPQMISFLKAAAKLFNSKGFTHIRDMGTTEDQFLCAADLEKSGELSLLVIHNFICENLKDFDRAMGEALRCRQKESELLKVAGLKFYFDGSLGSNTALLSAPYEGKVGNTCGVVNWKEEDLAAVMRKTWQQGFEVSVHTIGDEAAHRVVQIARKIYSEGISGHLNLEHAQVMRPETIQSMKSLHVTCYMQPCHWLSDRQWLDKKLAALSKYAFPWEALRLAKVPIFFGSDSPIEPISIFNALKALDESKDFGIRAFGDDPLKYHVCSKWKLPNTYTKISSDKIEEVVFKGKRLS
jgi:predicted amidohydrolase YtcJ